MRFQAALAVVLTLPGSCLASTLTAPFARVVLGGSGLPEPGIGHNLGGSTGAFAASASRTHQPGDVATYAVSASASFGNLRASSRQSGTLPFGGSGRVRNASAFFWDQLYIDLPGSTASVMSWELTVRLTGWIDWTGNGVPVFPPGGAEVAQSVRVEGQTGFTHYPRQLEVAEEGVYDLTVALPAITVPVNEWFNYRLLLGAYSLIENRTGSLYTSSESDFGSTLKGVGLVLRDDSGQAVDFEIASRSGAAYSASGITGVPEPNSMGLLIAATIALLVTRRRVSA